MAIAEVIDQIDKLTVLELADLVKQLEEKYGPQGFDVIGIPCNQFGEQEPGTTAEIASFCSETYAVTFPMFEKIDVNGPERHPLYAELTTVADATGKAGDVAWNFEKFVVSPDGEVVARFRSRTSPDAPEVVALIDSLLSAA